MTEQRTAAAERSASTGTERRGAGHHAPTQVAPCTLEQAMATAAALKAHRERRGFSLPEELLMDEIIRLAEIVRRLQAMDPKA